MSERGIKKWAPYKSLPEHDPKIIEMRKNRNKIEKPTLSDDEIEKINFPSESLFLPQGVFNGAPLLNAKILKLPENRVKITIWAMAVYNSQKAIYQPLPKGA